MSSASVANPLRGHLPTPLGNLCFLQRLTIMGAGFVGALPLELGRLRNVCFIDLFENNLVGRLSSVFAMLRRMQEFGA